MTAPTILADPPTPHPQHADQKPAPAAEIPAMAPSFPLPALRPARRALRVRHIVLGLAAASSLLAGLYWGCSPRTSMSARRKSWSCGRTWAGSIRGLGGLLSGLPGGGNRADQMLLRSHLLSLDMLARLDAELHLRQRYADHAHDPLARLRDAHAPLARFADYMKRRIAIDYDDNEGVLHVEAAAFDPQTAQAIVATMLREGAQFMNRNDHRLAQVQVDFLSGEAQRMGARNEAARKALLAYQNKAGMVSPEDTLQSVASTIAQLEARRSALQTQLGTLEAYLVPSHPDVVAVRQQIAAVDGELARERGRAASNAPGALNRSADAFRQLEQEAQFSQGLYQTTLAALEKGRITAMQAMKQVSVIQSPSLPEYPARPRRFVNTLVFTLAAFLTAGIALLLVAVVRDHID
jgi:capsular polysaccharide transport system permease protein